MEKVQAEIITIGDELLIGQVLDTNSQWLAVFLSQAGIELVRRTSIGDDAIDIAQALDAANQRASIIIITGGLGPTKDDITKSALAAHFNTELELNHEALKMVTDFFERRGRPLTEVNRQQAMLPAVAKYLPNHNGTAPGMWFEQNSTVYISLPGVPFEMKALMEDEVMPRLKKHFELPTRMHTTVLTAGIGESDLADKLNDFETHLPYNVKMAYLPGAGRVRLRLNVNGPNLTEVKQQLTELESSLIEHLGTLYYGKGNTTLEEVIGQKLNKARLTLAVAESCTGGYLGHLITTVPGSSAYFEGGVQAYNNNVKKQLLQVPADLIEQHGAVSAEVAAAMAQGVKKLLNTDVALAITGIAGPDGGTPQKPVGTVYIAVTDKNGTESRHFNFGWRGGRQKNGLRGRELNITLAAVSALNMLRLRPQLLNLEP